MWACRHSASATLNELRLTVTSSKRSAGISFNQRTKDLPPKPLCNGCAGCGGASGGGGSGGTGPAKEGLADKSDGLVATREELTPAEQLATQGLVATRELDDDAAAEQFMPAESAAAEWVPFRFKPRGSGTMSKGPSCSWRCPEQSKHKILYACPSPNYDGTRTRAAETKKHMKARNAGITPRKTIKMLCALNIHTTTCSSHPRPLWPWRNAVGNHTEN